MMGELLAIAFAGIAAWLVAPVAAGVCGSALSANARRKTAAEEADANRLEAIRKLRKQE